MEKFEALVSNGMGTPVGIYRMYILWSRLRSARGEELQKEEGVVRAVEEMDISAWVKSTVKGCYN